MFNCGHETHKTGPRTRRQPKAEQLPQPHHERRTVSKKTATTIAIPILAELASGNIELGTVEAQVFLCEGLRVEVPGRELRAALSRGFREIADELDSEATSE